MKEMAAQARDTLVFLSRDDTDYREPGHLLSSGLRGRTSLVTSNTLLGELDHDVKKRGHIIPSFYIKCGYPK